MIYVIIDIYYIKKPKNKIKGEVLYYNMIRGKVTLII